MITNLPIEELLDGNNFRSVNPKKVEELAHSIKKHGVLQPIRVRKTDTGYFIVYGHHRVAACRKLGLSTIRAEIITGMNSQQADVLQIVENLHRNEEKNYTLLGDYFKKLLRENWTREQIVDEIGKSYSFLDYCVKLSDKIEPSLHKELSSTIPRPCTYTFGRIPIPKQRNVIHRLNKKLEKEKMSTWDIEVYLRRYVPKPPKRMPQYLRCSRCDDMMDESAVRYGKSRSDNYQRRNPILPHG